MTNTPGVFLGALALVFIALKLMGHITWSWWLVLLPLYGPIILVLVIAIIVLIARKFW